ncbi:unnamed protein product [Caenorhabditis sp. 36 PRJEB53466]|nr:unnamed protein product [Caenorhabditis sp. 36 PRJEB53466]
MSIESLHQLASTKMAEYILNGSIDTSSASFSQKQSNAIFEKLVQLKKPETGRNQRLLEQLAGLNVSRVSLKNVEVTSSDVTLLGKQELETFALGRTNLLMDAYRFENEPTSLDIVSLLEKMFNAATRQSLRHLDISGCESFNGDWLRAIGSVLPNLVSLNVAGRRPVDIRVLAQSFPGLQCLNVSNCDIDSLDGISGMRGLRVLIMENPYKIRDMTELFDLRELRVLNMACPFQFNADGSDDVAAHFCQCLEAGSRLLKLRTLDLSKTRLTKNNAETIMRTVPTIQHLSTIGTGIDLSNRVEGYSTNSLNSTTKALEHYLSEHSAQMIGAVLKESFVLTDDFHFDMTGGFIPFEDIMMFTTCMISVLRRYKNDATIQGEAVVNLWTLTESTTSLLLADTDWSDKITEWVAKLLDVFDACDQSHPDCKRYVTWYLWSTHRIGMFVDMPANSQRILFLAMDMLMEQKDDVTAVDVIGEMFRGMTCALSHLEQEQITPALDRLLCVLSSLTLEEERGNDHFAVCIESCVASIRLILDRFEFETPDGFVERLIDVLRHSRNNEKTRLDVLELLNRLIGSAGKHEEFRTPSAIETLKQFSSADIPADNDGFFDVTACNIAFLAFSLLSRLLLHPADLSEDVRTLINRHLLDVYSRPFMRNVNLAWLGTDHWIDDVRIAVSSEGTLEASVVWALYTLLEGLQFAEFRESVDEDMSDAVRILMLDDRKGVADLAAQVAYDLPEDFY